MEDQVGIEVSLSWKTEYLDCCITATRAYYEEDSHCGRQTCIWDVKKVVLLGECIFQLGGLDIWQYSPLRTELLKSYWVYSEFYWIYPKNPVIVSRSKIHKLKREVFIFSSILPYLLPFSLTSLKTMPRCLKSSVVKCSKSMRRSNSSRLT